MTTELALDLLQEARACALNLIDAEETVRRDIHRLCVAVWKLGEALVPLKEEVGHGKWGLYVIANFPQLGESDKSRHRRVQEAMEFYRENPKYAELGVFDVDSIRKCVFHLAPEKERPQLPGDQNITRSPHQLGFVNEFMKLDHRIEKGLANAPEPETFRKDVEPAVKLIIKYGGADWLRSLLTGTT